MLLFVVVVAVCDGVADAIVAVTDVVAEVIGFGGVAVVVTIVCACCS